jgi:hypothetical protein
MALQSLSKVQNGQELVPSTAVADEDERKRRAEEVPDTILDIQYLFHDRKRSLRKNGFAFGSLAS